MAFHKVGVPGVELLARERREQLHLEAHVSVDIEGTGAVLLREMLDACGVFRRVQAAVTHDVMRPGVCAVDRQQRVIEVEEGQPHRADSRASHNRGVCAHSRISGTVIERCAASA